MTQEQEIIIKTGDSFVSDVNIGTNYRISHILFLGDAGDRKLQIYKWSEVGNDYFPIFLSTYNEDLKIDFIQNKWIFFNQYILNGEKFKFEFNSPVTQDIRMILLKFLK